MFNSITTTRSIQCSPHNVTWFQLSLASQTHFHKIGKGLVNCVYKPCRAALYSAVQSRCSNSSHDTLHHCGNSSLENSKRELGHLFRYCRNCENTSRLVFRERSYSATGNSRVRYLKSGYVIQLNCIPVGHGLHTQFTRPFPPRVLRKGVWLVRQVSTRESVYSPSIS